MIELQLQELTLVSGGNGTAVANNIVSNTANIATTREGLTWGDVLALPAAAGATYFLRGGTKQAAASAATYNLIRDWTNDAINAPPYNGRPIFEIEHGLTAPASTTDKSGNNYDGTNY
ncbi:hypothetical protein [Neisseria yangbaofengii]|uniref:hypothetical protein n=1 Tax=Neisseria yangbaofengii TaxID=2709396 RepID=UPI0013EBB124|nr:hypothetical protein [Neisseria yangbaofengii]